MVRHQHNMLSLADSDRNLEDYPQEYIWEPGEVPGRNRSGPVTTRRWAVVRIIQQLLLRQRSNDRMTMEEFRLLPYDIRHEIASYTLEQLHQRWIANSKPPPIYRPPAPQEDNNIF